MSLRNDLSGRPDPIKRLVKAAVLETVVLLAGMAGYLATGHLALLAGAVIIGAIIIVPPILGLRQNGEHN